MLDKLRSVWDYPVLYLGGGQALQVSQIVLVAVLLVLGYLASKLVERLIERRLTGTSVTTDAAHALKRISFYTVITIVVMMALRLLHIPWTAFAFVSGAVAIGVGFGAQNIVNNFISGWILVFERPVRIDDFIELDDAKGIVERIGNRSTRIRRTDGVHILVPNSHLLEQKVVNWTLIDYDIRSVVRVGVAYGSPTRLVVDLIGQAIDAVPGIRKNPEPLIVFEDFGDNALIFDAFFWSEIHSERDQRVLRSELRFKIDELFRQNGIVIAFPQRDLHVNTLSPLEIRLLEPQPKKSGKK